MLRRAISFARPYRLLIAFILALTLFVAAMNAIEPLILKLIFDGLGEGEKVRTILLGIGLLVGLAVIREVTSGFSDWLTWRTRLNIQYSLLDELVGRLHRLPLDAHRKDGVGAIMTRLDRGISGFIGALAAIAFNIIPALAYLVMAIVVMAQIDMRLTILALSFAPIPGIIAALAAPNQTKREQSLLDRWVRIYSRFNEVLAGIVTVRSFAMEDYEKRRFLGGVRDANGLVIKGVRFDSGVIVAQKFTVATARIAAIAYGGWLVVNGEATLGTLIAFLSYVGGLFGPIEGLTGVYRTLCTASAALKQVYSILDAQEFLGDRPDAREVGKLRGEVAFEGLTFGYRHCDKMVLQGIDIHARPGEMVAIVGPSGSGKSTLMALLQRFYDPLEGCVKLDGQDLRDLKQNSIRRNIAVVLQDALLFNESVRDNIAYGRPQATLDEVEEAARAANAHEFIVRMEEGYDTLVGERGARLSVGERQRIAIARAILKRAPILILDEATSALDADLEAKVQEALERLVKNRTTFVIAHRLSTIVHADRILVLMHGRIVEEGSHRELMALQGYYHHLVSTQTRGLIAR